ncbi:MAG: class I SAM-dependent methyltransferase [Myxococcaceae bacterium]|nr:class I SAM-dependent methyltransferase [Myxococcaceae bacterium]
MSVFYGELARWWPLLSPVDEYKAEAGFFARVLGARIPEKARVLELGSGGGHNAFHLKQHFVMTLTDLSPQMIEVSQRLNPDCEHAVGDMRTLSLGRTFDAVFVHDALSYLTTEVEVSEALDTVSRHLGRGGVALLIPDETTETFEPGTECGGADAPDGSGARYLEWVHPVPPGQTHGVTDYAFVVREADGTTRSFHESHPFGLFPHATWARCFDEAGFDLELVEEETDEDRRARTLYVGTKR